MSCYNENTNSPTLDAFLVLNKNPIKEDTCNFKGYKWEMTVRYALKKIPLIEYEGNPTNYYDWLHEHNKNNYDGNVTLPNGKTITLEMKFRNCKKVYHSWFVECWLPREADVFVTNNTDVISYADRRLLDSQHKKLMSLSEFIVYLGRLLRNILHPSKYLYFNRVFYGLFRVIIIVFVGSSGLCRQVFDRINAEFSHNGLESRQVKNDKLINIIGKHRSLDFARLKTRIKNGVHNSTKSCRLSSSSLNIKVVIVC